MNVVEITLIPEGPLVFALCPNSRSMRATDPCFQNFFLLTLPATLAFILFAIRITWLEHHGKPHHLGRTAFIYWPSLFLMLFSAVTLLNVLINPSTDHDLSAKLAIGSMFLAWFTIRSSDFILSYYIIAIFGSGILLYTETQGHSETSSVPDLYFVSLILGFIVEAWPRGRTQVQRKSGASVFEKANLISRLSFHYIQQVMSIGYKRPLQLTDVVNLMPERIKSENAYATLAATWKQREAQYLSLPKDKQQKQQPWLLLKTIAATYGWIGWAPIVACRVVSTTLVYLQPVLLGRILDFMQSSASDSPQPLSNGILLAVLMFLTSLSSSITGAQLTQLNADRGMEIRSGLIGLIYRKALKLSPEARRTQTTGSITNHMSVDTEKWTNALTTLPQWISAPIEVIVALWLLYRQLGWCALVGLFTVLGLMPLQNKVSGIFSEIKETKLTAMDSRIRLVTELFTSIKTIKLYAWEDAFKSKIAGYRETEMAVLRRFGVVYAAMTITYSTTMFMSLLSFGIYAVAGGPGGTPGEITPHTIFVSLALFGLLSKPISWMDHLLSDTTSILVATRRIQGFLLSEELQDNLDSFPSHRNHHHPTQYRRTGSAIVVQDGVFSWNKLTSDSGESPIAQDENTPLLSREGSPATNGVPTLRDININLEAGSLTAIVGRIGQGKSSLISALIGDMYCYKGFAKLNGNVAYVAQEAWIMNCTVKDNILFGKPLDQDRYERILQACSLSRDLNMLPAGDQTEIGERGINLSGGQKQRVALARAAYQDADIYLFDDPLSAVDAHVDQHLWQNLIGPNGLLKDKTRLLVTHGIHHLNEVDKIVVMKNGTISELGSFEQLLDARQGFYQLNLDRSRLEFSNTNKRRKHANKENAIQSQDDSDSGSDVADNTDTATEVGTNPQEKKAENTNASLVTAEKTASGGVGWRMFMVYAKAASYINIISVIVLYIFVEVAQVGTSYWLRFWSDSAGQDKYTVTQFLVIYGSFTLAYMAFNMALFYVANVKAAIMAAQRLHDRLLDNLLRQSMAFFDVTPVGRIINRFSSDVESVDEVIIWNFIDVVYCLVAIGGTLVVISISTPLFLLVVPPLAISYIYVQNYYIRSSQALKRLMSVSKSPLYQHFSETLAGVSTIRAMNATPRFITINEKKADISAETTLAFGMCSRWLKVRLEFLGALIVLAAALLAVLNFGHLSASVVGLSLTYATSITMDITYLVRTWSEMSNQLICVERIEEYAELRQEAPAITGTRLPVGWPNRGQISFQNYSARYRERLSLVLKNVTFEAQPGEKIGIVGRTGAGKSSLTLALFRMIEAADSYWARSTSSDQGATEDLTISGGLEKSIEIDGVDIATLGLKTLRQHLSIIPQDPTLFVGTVRENLDPFSELSDAELWTALERAHLKDHISSLTGGLSFEVAQNGENFSVGQRSLICLARALLRKTKILILDEATAAVDVETDELIQKTIRKEFKDRTILTIAHRIKTVMDSDKILVLDQGRVREYDTPEALLSRKDGLFYSLAEQAGEIPLQQ
ncbi:Multidrug resistance-associated protein 1 [Entomortierella chlamydospora]|uniref:Multidrug resistance-associated protein 1 n=1 Tax=Entomortierella chlamydospora TaxID=101097 RepID=A0A9P6T1B0_9FUNG|nr:Multidrug resistance-associated protein 1 [Entomortierella chlamydospora]